MLTVEKKIDSQLRVSIPRNYFAKLGVTSNDNVLVSYNDKTNKIEIYKEKQGELYNTDIK